MSTFVVGEAMHEGLECVVVRIEFYIPEEELEGAADWDQQGPRVVESWTEQLLCPSRNYLPLLAYGYASGYSDEIPLDVWELTDVREIEPGVWFPFEWILTHYDELDAAQGRKHVSDHTTWNVKSVNLNPQYPREFFSDIPIPEGARIHYLRDGEILRTEPGTSAAAARDSKSRIVMWFILANLAALSGITIVLLRRRSRHRLTLHRRR